MKDNHCLIIAAAGTMGHINPGLSFAKLLKKTSPKIKIIFLSLDKNVDQIIKHHNFTYIDELKTITAIGFSRKNPFKNLRLIKSSFETIKEIRKIYQTTKADLVFGMGGFISGYALKAAQIEKIPYLLHEQNTTMGLANTLTKRKAQKVFVSFPKKGRNIKLIGNPRLIEAMEIKPDKQNIKNHIVVMSGSLGAKFINSLIVDFLKTKESHNYFTTLVTGKKYYEETILALKDINAKHYEIIPYLPNPLKTLSDADLLISRSGATTIFEVIGLMIPTIFIPSPNVTKNHQYKNAMYLKKEGAGVILLEREATLEHLNKLIKQTISNAIIIKNLKQQQLKYYELLKQIDWNEYFEKNN